MTEELLHDPRTRILTGCNSTPIFFDCDSSSFNELFQCKASARSLAKDDALETGGLVQRHEVLTNWQPSCHTLFRGLDNYCMV